MIQLRSPAENQLTIDKTPEIVCAVKQPIETETLFVMLDGIDITQMLEFDAQGFSFQPFRVLEPGPHNLTVSGQSAQGEPFNYEYTFSTRHYEGIEKGFSQNELTAYAETAVSKSDSLEMVPDNKFVANLNSVSQLKEKGFEMSFAANMRYLDQSEPTVYPEEKGLDLIDFLLTAAYEQGGVGARAEVGDTEVKLSENTLPWLTRRGGQLAAGTETVKIGGFSVQSDQTYGFDDGIDIGTDDTDNIYGAFGDINLLEKRLSLRAVYSRGGEAGDSFGMTTLDGHKEGEVAGAILRTDFFEGKLISEFEYDRSDFDPDTSDDAKGETDEAYRFYLGGGAGRYTYDASYRYFGPDYEVIGNPGLEKDREAIGFNAGAAFEKQGLSIAYNRYKDNVDEAETKPIIITHSGTLTYSYFGIEKLPFSMTYQKEMAESSDEPLYSYPIDRDIDMVSGSITYTESQWSLGFQGSQAEEDDHTDTGADISTTTLSLLPQYFTSNLIISPNLSYVRSKDHATEVSTTSRTLTLDIQGNMFEEKLVCGLGGTVDQTTTSDHYIDQRTLSVFYSLNYKIGQNLWGYFTPVVGIRGEYNEIDDRISNQTTRDHLLMLTFSTNVPFSF